MPLHRKRSKQVKDSRSISKGEPSEKLLRIENDDTPKETKNLYWSFENPAVLGRGSFGSVEIWYHHSKGILCAAKTFKDDDEFRRELQQVKEIDHENVIRCLGSYEQQRVIFYNLCSTTLNEMLEKEMSNHFGIDESMLMLLIKNMIGAQEYLIKRLKIVHRDIKPANILYDDRRFVLADFGMATKYDPENMTYTDFIRGTPNFMRPEIRAKIKSSQEHEFSVNSELWSLAVTFFLAATGKYPFKTKTRNRSIGIARDKPAGSFWIDQDETYMFELRGYNRLSPEFQARVLSPLLAYMMSDEADFEGLFAFIERHKLDKDLLYVFEVNAFKLRTLPCDLGRDYLNSVMSAAKINEAEHVLVHQAAELSPVNGKWSYSIPKTTEFSPIICCNRRFESVNDIDLGKSLFKSATDFFSEVRIRYYENDVRCVFANVVNAADTCQRWLKFMSEFGSTYCDSISRKQVELKCLSDCLEKDVQSLFKLHQPTEEFSNLVSDMKFRTKKALLPIVFEDNPHITENECVISFNQHIDYLSQRKFSANRKEHVLQIKKSMDLLVDAITKAVRDFVSSFHKWYEEARKIDVELKCLLSETQYVQSELNRRLVTAVMEVGTT